MNAGTGGINIGTSGSARTTNIATGAASQSVLIGSTNGTSSLTLDAGTGAISIGSSSSSRTINIGTSTSAAVNTAINLGNSSGSASTTINIGNYGTGTPSTSNIYGDTVNIGTVGASTITVNIGRTTATTSKTTIQGGTSSGGGVVLSQSGGRLGFFGLATPITKTSVTGSRSGGTALTNLLTALANYGLITDSTTA